MTTSPIPTDLISTRAWGRICLFGEHQDYLGLPVIAAAVDLCISIVATPRNDNRLTVELPDIEQYYEYELDAELPYMHKRDYLPSAVNVMRREGVILRHGWHVEVHGTIPINAGASSSSALMVAMTQFLLEAAGASRTPEEVAILANRAEVLEFGEPGGLMDHYMAALGGVYCLDFSVQPATVERLHAPISGFVLGHSLEPKSTTGVLGRARAHAEAALAWVQEHHPELDPRVSPREAFARVLPAMPPELRRKLEANLMNRDLCRQGRDMLRQGPVDPVELGRMLYEHHRQLAEGIGVSTPKLDRMVQAAMEAGAFGGKLNGSGGGGCMYAYAPGREHEVASALEAAGGQAFILSLPEGPG